MGLEFDFKDGQTPLDDDEKEGLLISTIGTRGELDEFEQKNIEGAVLWSIGRSFKPDTVFEENFIKAVHKRMYGEVWKWAGEFRKTNKNIGVDKWQISTELRKLLDDVKYWHTNNTYTPDECTMHFKHRLVSIHCFPNGNGRHSRLIADIIIEKIYKQSLYTWGANSHAPLNELRGTYLNAIRAADKGEIKPLIDFARS